jgi:hypothetical protein
VWKVAATPATVRHVANYYANLLKENGYYSIGSAITKMRSLPSKNEKSDMLMLLLLLCSDAPMMSLDVPQLSLTIVSDLSLTIEESPEETGGG